MEEGKNMKRFQNATMEYNLAKNDLVIRDVNSNAVFFAIEFFENSKQIKRVFSLYPVSVEIDKNKVLELEQLLSDKRTVINISNDDLSNITLN